MISVKLRYPLQEDSSFIVASWLSSVKKHLDKDIPYDIRHNEYKNLIQTVLSNDTNVIVAVSPEDDDYINGYAVYNHDVLHYIYVRYALRRQGLATFLMESIIEPKYITHKPLWYYKAKDELKKKFIYNPFIFYKGHTKNEDN